MDKKIRNKLLSYFIMGDGGVYYQDKCKGSNCAFIMNMRTENKDYIDWVTSVINSFSGVNIYDRKDYNTDGCIRSAQKRIESKRHPVFTQFRKRIYHEGYKGLDPMYIKQLDWQTLGILYMCDGSLSVKKDGRKYITLNMKRLTLGDMGLLQKHINKLTKFDWRINKNGKYYYLALLYRFNEEFVKQIDSYILPSFKYKTNLSRTYGSPLHGDDDTV